jgi:hypothetical protein
MLEYSVDLGKSGKKLPQFPRRVLAARAVARRAR